MPMVSLKLMVGAARVRECERYGSRVRENDGRSCGSGWSVKDTGGSRDTHGTRRAHTGTRITQTNVTTIQTHQETRTTARCPMTEYLVCRFN